MTACSETACKHHAFIDLVCLSPPPHPLSGAVDADEGVLAELESHGYARAATLRHLANGEANYAVASYCLLAEAKAEAARKLMPKPAWPFSSPVVRSSGSSSTRRTSGGQPQQVATAAAQQQQGAGGARPSTASTAAAAQRPSSAVAVAVA